MSQPQIREVQRWKKPAEGVLKVNCDGAHEPEEKRGGWGFVIRDEEGDVIKACWGRIGRSFDALQAEAIACWHGVSMAMELGIGNIELETDSLLLKQALSTNDYNRSLVRGIIIEIKNMIRY
ncbi:hypothetical protein HU200_006373 [Digitaria exilis]|uniref:RNase H type-1 domain-containing protein n=1 Tax=Digitaria exilis TaxID=1010633 RepID=A0A835FSL5_9POAL|nr:hypothetical protein HU200_006373 [Digitaria exilis]